MIKDAVFFTEKQGRSDMLNIIVKTEVFTLKYQQNRLKQETLVGFSRGRGEK